MYLFALRFDYNSIYIFAYGMKQTSTSDLPKIDVIVVHILLDYPFEALDLLHDLANLSSIRVLDREMDPGARPAGAGAEEAKLATTAVNCHQITSFVVLATKIA